MLAIDLPQSVENRLFLLSKTTGISQDILAQKAICQYLENLEMVYQVKNSTIQTAQIATKKAAQSRAGALASYANPRLIAQEKMAWSEAMLNKHGLENHGYTKS